jgi:hypothetical protein
LTLDIISIAMRVFYPSCLEPDATIAQIIKFRVSLPARYFTFFEFCVTGLLIAIRATAREIPVQQRSPASVWAIRARITTESMHPRPTSSSADELTTLLGDRS